MTATDPGTLARKMFELLNARDLDAFAALQHPDIVEDFVVLRVYNGKDEVRRFFEGLLAAFPDFRIDIVHLASSGDDATAEWTVSGTFEGGAFEGIAPNGKRIELRGVDCMRFEGGLLRRNTIYYDGAAFARAVGLLPAAGSGPEKALTAAFNAVTSVRKSLGL